mgnify:CR=1 FL=1
MLKIAIASVMVALGGFFQFRKHVSLETVALAYVEAREPALAAAVLKKAVEAARVYEKNKYSSSKESTVSNASSISYPPPIRWATRN